MWKFFGVSSRHGLHQLRLRGVKIFVECRKDRQEFIVQKIHPNSRGDGPPARGMLVWRSLKPKTTTTAFQNNFFEFRFKATRLEEFDSLWVRNL